MTPLLLLRAELSLPITHFLSSGYCVSFGSTLYQSPYPLQSSASTPPPGSGTVPVSIPCVSCGSTLYQFLLPPTEQRLHSSPWERNCIYPLCFLILVSVTLLALAMVAINIGVLIINPAEHLSVQVRGEGD